MPIITINYYKPLERRRYSAEREHMLCYARIISIFINSFRWEIIITASFIQTATASLRQSARLLSARNHHRSVSRSSARAKTNSFSDNSGTDSAILPEVTRRRDGGECVHFIYIKREFFVFSCRNFKLACHHFLQKRAGLFSASFSGAPQQANNWRGRGHRHDRGAGHRNSASGPNLCGFSALRNDRHLPDDLWSVQPQTERHGAGGDAGSQCHPTVFRSRD